jgi:hypothetical protein
LGTGVAGVAKARNFGDGRGKVGGGQEGGGPGITPAKTREGQTRVSSGARPKRRAVGIAVHDCTRSVGGCGLGAKSLGRARSLAAHRPDQPGRHARAGRVLRPRSPGRHRRRQVGARGVGELTALTTNECPSEALRTREGLRQGPSSRAARPLGRLLAQRISAVSGMPARAHQAARCSSVVRERGPTWRLR